MPGQILRAAPVLCGLEDDALDFLLGKAIRTPVAAGEIIVREGEADNHFFFISEGQVRVCRRFGTSDEIELARLGPGDFFGEMCILEAQPRSASVQAIADTVLYSLTSMAFYNLYQQMPAQHSILMVNIARDLSRRLRHLDQVFTGQQQCKSGEPIRAAV